MEDPKYYLDPPNQKFADSAAGTPPPQGVTTAQYRQGLEDLQKHAPIPGVSVTSFVVPFEDGVKTYIFRPNAVKASEPLPAMVYFHGGWWKAGSVKSYDSICRELVLRSGCALVFPEYTRVPEARFPTLHEQCYAVTKWVYEHGATKALMTQQGVAVLGDSAGGQLSTAVTILSKTRKPLIPILQQVLISPALDLVISDRPTLSEFEFFNGPFANDLLFHTVLDEYIPNLKDREGELASAIRISPAHAKQQPPTLIVVSSADLLRDLGIEYGHILQGAGVECAIIRAEGQVHDSYFLEATRKGATPSAMVTLMAVTVRSALERTEGTPNAVVSGADEGKSLNKRKRTRR